MRRLVKQKTLALIILAVLALAGSLAAGCGNTNESRATCGEDIDTTGQQYIRNGDFFEGLNGWQKIDTSGQLATETRPVTGVNRVLAERDTSCGDSVTLHRENGGSTSALAGIEQTVDVPSSSGKLKLQMVVKIDYQQMTSDGSLGGEAPVFITLDYETADGTPRSWTHGFLVDNSQINYPDRDQTITPSYWYTYNVENLFELCPDAAHISRVTVGGNGQDFNSHVRAVSLLGK